MFYLNIFMSLCCLSLSIFPIKGACDVNLNTQNEKLTEFLRRYHLSEFKNDKGGSPLAFAALTHENEIAAKLLLKGADPNELDLTKSSTPLSIAIENGNKELVERFLIAKGNPNQLIENIFDACMPQAISQNSQRGVCGPDRYSLLQIAIKGKHLEIAKLLLDHGADLNYRSEMRYQPIHLAVRQADPAIVKLLLEKGADANSVDMWGYAPLHYTAFFDPKNDPSLVASLLIEYGADVNKKIDVPVAKYTPLHLAAANGQGDLTQTLLKHSADVNSQDAFGCTALWSAINSKKEVRDILRGLILAGSNPNGYSEMTKKDETDLIYLDSPLALAVRKNKNDTLQYLLENRANPNLIDGNGNTALLVAVETGNLEAATLLVNHGANPTLSSTPDKSPVARAAVKKHLAFFDLLIKAEANQILN